MLIDRTHSRWAMASLAIGVITTGVYVWADRRQPGGLTGGSIVGLWFGIGAAGLMIFAMLLSALRKVPSWWWIGSRQSWLRGHIWLGTLSGWMSLYHSGFRWGGPLERGVWVLLALTLLTGVFGLILQQLLPRLITARVPRESPYEQIPHLCAGLRSQADDLIEEIRRLIEANPRATSVVEGDEAAKEKLRRYYEDQVRPFLSEPYLRSSPLASPMGSSTVVAAVRVLSWADGVSELATHLGEVCESRRQLGVQRRIHLWLHAWLLVHVPVSWALLALVVCHAFWSLYY